MKRKIFKVNLLIYATVALLFISCQSSNTSNINSIATDSVSIRLGNVSFNQHCASCHNFKQDGIGPQLAGITALASTAWLKEFIKSPKTILESGDEKAKVLFNKYHTVMPDFASLPDVEINRIIAFLQTQKAITKKKEKPDPLAIKNPLPEAIAPSGLTVDLQLVTQFPYTSKEQPFTRISKLDFPPHSNTMFMLDQRGILYALKNGKPAVYLDIAKWKPNFINTPGLATGFGSFAFHPEFQKNGLFYTTHTEAPNSKKAYFNYNDSIKVTLQWVVCEWKEAHPGSFPFAGTCRELFRVNMVSGIHGVQEVTFNPLAKKGDEDYGQLYIGIGDGGSVENGYPFLAHRLDRIWGTVIRIDPLGHNSANGQYGISPHNPFSKRTGAEALPEIYAYGFRNPDGFAFNPVDGGLWECEFGPRGGDEINLIKKGGNYGWPIREGTFALHPLGNINNVYHLPGNDSIYHITYPIAQYDHDEGNAIAGGFEYEETAIPQLKGKYLFGDIPKGRLFMINIGDIKLSSQAPIKEWQVAVDGNQVTLPKLCGSDRVDLRFGKDEKGEMYLFTKPDGKLYKLMAAYQQ